MEVGTDLAHKSDKSIYEKLPHRMVKLVPIICKSGSLWYGRNYTTTKDGKKKEKGCMIEGFKYLCCKKCPVNFDGLPPLVDWKHYNCPYLKQGNSRNGGFDANFVRDSLIDGALHMPGHVDKAELIKQMKNLNYRIK